MDNQIFPIGIPYLDEMAQVCMLCGIQFNNAISLQHHMQLHILTANTQMLGSQTSADPSMGFPTGNILDFIGASQHGLISSVASQLIPQQSKYSGQAISMASHILSPGLVPVSAMPNIPMPQLVSRKKEKPKTLNVKQSNNASIGISSNSSIISHVPGSVKSRDTAASNYISTLPRDHQKCDIVKPTNSQQKSVTLDTFLPPVSSQLDPLEALALTSSSKTLERQLSRAGINSPHDAQVRDTNLFQPFVSRENQAAGGFGSKINPTLTAKGLVSPLKASSNKSDLDILSTPQKISYHISNENLLSTPHTVPQTTNSDIRYFSMFQDSVAANLSFDKKLDSLSKSVHQTTDNQMLKCGYFPGLLDPLNISPNSLQQGSKKKSDSLLKVQAEISYESRSSSPDSKSRNSDYFSSQTESPRSLISPKISPSLPGSNLLEVNCPIPQKSQLFGNSLDSLSGGNSLPGSSLQSVVPQIFGSGTGSSITALASPAIGIAVNPLGTGYFNALTQKLIDPKFSVGADMNKSGVSLSGLGLDCHKGKSYFENGILINNDYDKISDTSDEDDLERLIDGIDTKNDNMDTKGYEIDDLLIELNSYQDDMKNKHEIDDFFINVMDEAKLKTEISGKQDEIFNPAEEIERNTIAISELLEMEKEKIDKESKELENARLNANGVLNSSAISTTTETPSSALTVVMSSSLVPPSVVSEAQSTNSGETTEKKEEDHMDFEIPKVGKLMKIRKYLEIEQKKKEQTEKHIEVKIHEKREPVMLEKPQTILVQVSKRKKIEYGPYINKQSLLEGKPKILAKTSPKTYRPKPKPNVPEKRTFNLRERKNRTDFASLANTGSKTSVKKSDGKEKSEDKPNDIKDTIEEENDIEISDEECTDIENTVSTNKNKVRTEDDVLESEKTSEGKEKSSESTCLETDAENHTEMVNQVHKFVLRSRSIKPDTENLDARISRKRTSKSLGETTKNMLKKVKENYEKSDGEIEEKITRSKAKQKVSPDKTEMKKCTVNLGEKYTDFKKKLTSKKSTKSSVPLSEKVHGMDANTENNFGVEDATDGQIKEITSKNEVKKKIIENKKENNIEKKSEHNDTDCDKTVSKLLNVVTIFETQEEYRNKNTESAHVANDSNNLCVTVSSDFVEKRLTMKFKLGPGFHRLNQEGLVAVKKKKKRVEKETKDSSEASSQREESASKLEKLPYNEIKVGDQSDKLLSGVAETKTSKLLNDGATTELKDEVNSVRSEVNVKLIKDGKIKLEKDVKDEQIQMMSDHHVTDEDPSNLKLEQCVNDNNETAIFKPLKDKLSLESQSEKSFNDQISTDSETLDDTTLVKNEKPVKHSVENEFQRLVKEAMAEVKNAQNCDSGKQERYVNLRKRLNDNVKYNVDDSDEDVENLLFTSVRSKSPKLAIKATRSLSKISDKSTQNAARYKMEKQEDKRQLKKDIDVYDFTDTEMSDHEDNILRKRDIKPKYVSNLNIFAQKKLPFICKPFSSSQDGTLNEISAEINSNVKSENYGNQETENEVQSEISYEKQTVEPLKIKLTMIKPFRVKKHKHKKKKKKNKERKEKEMNTYSAVAIAESIENDVKKIDEEKNIDCVSLESNSNEGDDESVDGNNIKLENKLKFRERKHVCEYCNLGFVQRCDLRRHIMIHTGERPWPCQTCDKKFQRKTDLVKHTRTHTGEKPYACEFCDKRVSDKSQLNVHRRLHTGDRPYQCNKCGKKCITSSELSRHRMVHCCEKIQMCNLCHKTFTIKECLGMHMKLHYRSRNKSFQCETCAIGYDKKSNLDAHKCVNSLSSVYVCSECYEEFIDEMLYAEHIKTHDLGVLACNVCTNIFEDKHSLETHLCSLGMEKQHQFLCDICELECQDEDLLLQHMSIHDHDTGSFMCDLCSDIFIVRKDFTEHTKKHEESIIVKTEPGSISSLDVTGNSASQDESDDDIAKLNRESTDESMVSAGNVFANKSRASIISIKFRGLEAVDFKTPKQEKPSLCQSQTGAVSAFNDSSKHMCLQINTQSQAFLDNSRLTNCSEFANSPDFSLLSDDVRMAIDPFPGVTQKIGASVKNQGRSFEKSAVDENQGLKDIVHLNTAVENPRFSLAASNGMFSSSQTNFHLTSSSRKSQDNAIFDDSVPGSEHKFNYGTSHLTASAPAHVSQNLDVFSFVSPGENSEADLIHTPQKHFARESHGHSQSVPGYPWHDNYPMSVSDYVNSLLSKMGSVESKSSSDLTPKPFSVKSENTSGAFTKSSITHVPSLQRIDLDKRDDIENQMKSNIYSEFNFPNTSPKSGSTLLSNSFKSGANFSTVGSSAAFDPNSNNFHGSDQNLYNRESFSVAEKPDLSTFAQNYFNMYTQGSFNASSNSNLFSGFAANLDTNIRSVQTELFSTTQDLMSNNFFLSDDEEIKDVHSSDKGQDETTALLSHFDYSVN